MSSRTLGRMVAVAVAVAGAGLVGTSVSGVASLDGRLERETVRQVLPVTEEVVDRHVRDRPCRKDRLKQRRQRRETAPAAKTQL